MRGLQQRGFDLCVVSFASSPETQRAVQQKALQFECELIRPFTSVDIVNRKFRSDPQKRPSVCGLITSKAEQVSLRGACVFVDDQSKLLQDVEDLQSRRAEKHRCKCLKSEAIRSEFTVQTCGFPDPQAARRVSFAIIAHQYLQ